MAKAVVDHLEAVEVEHQQDHALAVSVRPDQGMVDPVVEQRSVGQPRQRIVEGLMGQFVLQQGPIGDVPGVQDEALDHGIGDGVGDDALDVAPRAVSVTQPALDRVGPTRLSGEPGDQGPQTNRALCVREVRVAGAERLLQPHAQEAGHRRTLEHDPALSINHGDEIGRVVDQRAELRRLLGSCPPQEETHGHRRHRSQQAQSDPHYDEMAEGGLSVLRHLPDRVVRDGRELSADHAEVLDLSAVPRVLWIRGYEPVTRHRQ